MSTETRRLRDRLKIVFDLWNTLRYSSWSVSRWPFTTGQMIHALHLMTDLKLILVNFIQCVDVAGISSYSIFIFFTNFFAIFLRTLTFADECCKKWIRIQLMIISSSFTNFLIKEKIQKFSFSFFPWQFLLVPPWQFLHWNLIQHLELRKVLTFNNNLSLVDMQYKRHEGQVFR